MLAIVVTEAVLNSGTVVSAEQLKNIPLMLVTLAVLNNGTDTSDKHA